MVPVRAIDSQLMRLNFSSHASDYDGYASVQKRVVKILLDQLNVLNPEAGQRGLWLDVGTGTGSLAGAILARSLPPQLVISDIAHGMTAEAASRLTKAYASDGDARALPFKNEVFAAVVSSSVYQWVDCLPAAFAEVGRVLESGGLFAVALFGENTLYELRDSHRRAMGDGNNRRSSHVQSFPALDEVSTALASAGLVCECLRTSMEVEYHADVPELLRQLKKIGASNAASNRPRGLASRRVMQAMINHYETSYRSDKGVPASYEVIIALAVKP